MFVGTLQAIPPLPHQDDWWVRQAAERPVGPIKAALDQAGSADHRTTFLSLMTRSRVRNPTLVKSLPPWLHIQNHLHAQTVAEDRYTFPELCPDPHPVQPCDARAHASHALSAAVFQKRLAPIHELLRQVQN